MKTLVRCVVLVIAVPPLLLGLALVNARGWLFTGEVTNVRRSKAHRRAD